MIDIKEFESILAYLRKDPKTICEVEFLLKWYRLDNNQQPAVYRLLPITTHLKNYFNKVQIV